MASAPAAFCLLSRPNTSRSVSSFSCDELAPKVLPRSARCSRVPAPRSTSPVLQSWGGRSACDGMATPSAGGPGNLAATVSMICCFEGRAVVGSPLTSASYFILASPTALDSFPSCTRCNRVSSSMVFAPPSGGGVFGLARMKGSAK